MIEWLSHQWNITTTPEIVQKWDTWDPFISGIFQHAGLYDLTPLQNYTINMMDELADRFG